MTNVPIPHRSWKQFPDPALSLSDLRPISRDFFSSRDALALAPALLGCLLVRPSEGIAARITETEAYMGQGDAACHAAGGRRTARTRVMFHPGGVYYVYFTYGMYHCLNVVSGPEDSGEAVLIRAVEVLRGRDTASLRRFGLSYADLSARQKKTLSDGPGKLCIALGVDRSFNGLPCDDPSMFLAAGPEPPASAIRTAPRVGVDYAGEAARFPWRFILSSAARE